MAKKVKYMLSARFEHGTIWDKDCDQNARLAFLFNVLTHKQIYIIYICNFIKIPRVL
jgi:hypothetical protein